MVCLQQLAFLVPTLRPTRWQQSVSTARRRRRRNCLRVGWAVARRYEHQWRGSQHAGTAVCRTRHCQIGTRKPCRTLVCVHFVVCSTQPTFVLDLVVLRYSTPETSSVIFQSVIFHSVIFQSCKFQSCKFSYPAECSVPFLGLVWCTHPIVL